MPPTPPPSPFPLHAGNTHREDAPHATAGPARLQYLRGRWFLLRNGTSTCLFLKCRGRERISPWYYRVLVVWLVPMAATRATCQHHPTREHWASSVLSGNSLFSPLADIFIRLVKFPPTQTPTHDGDGKNTAKLGIYPWENWNLNHILLRIPGVCYLSGTCQSGNWSEEHAWKCPSKPALLLLYKRSILNVLTAISYCPYCRFYVLFVLCLWFYLLLSCPLYKWT